MWVHVNFLKYPKNLHKTLSTNTLQRALDCVTTVLWSPFDPFWMMPPPKESVSCRPACLVTPPVPHEIIMLHICQNTCLRFFFVVFSVIIHHSSFIASIRYFLHTHAGSNMSADKRFIKGNICMSRVSSVLYVKKQKKQNTCSCTFPNTNTKMIN